MKKILILISSLLFIGSFNAEARDTEIKICDIQVHSSDIALIRPCSYWSIKNSCKWGGWVSWSLKTTGGEKMYDTALTALRIVTDPSTSQNPKLVVRTNGSSCMGGYDEINMLRVVRQD